MKKQLAIFAVLLIVVAAAMRILRDAGVIDLPPNVAPIAALAMFGGAYLPRRLAFAIPLAAMILSDMIIGWYEPKIVISVYLLDEREPLLLSNPASHHVPIVHGSPIPEHLTASQARWFRPPQR